MDVVMKRYILYQSMKDDKGRDLGEEQRALELKKDSLRIAKIKPLHLEYDITLPVAEIKEISLYMEADAAEKSVIGRAAAGAILFGGVGAIVGGISGSGKKDAWYLEIATEEKTYIYRLGKEDDRKVIAKWANKHNL